ncbi:serine hydrolase domain-containing protein [Marinicaulis aureus]|uniref:Serine hydrolase domain-containing protein n=1 Tax=Hyphococcus aureus TaxID=2666033 RepID=A0ABW1KVR0_9PROT
MAAGAKNTNPSVSAACSGSLEASQSIPSALFEGPCARTDEELDNAFKALAADNLFSGAVLIAKDGRPLFQGAYGAASREYSIPNTVDTQFNLASAGKMFTAVSIAQLVEQGRLSYDDTIDKFLDETWLDPEIAKKITVSNLLSHTGGLSGYFNERYIESSRLLFREVKDFKPLVVDSALSFEPGSQWSYSNTGFLLLGAIIESVTGQDYPDYIKEHIFIPAGMTRTAPLDLDHINHGYAQGYARKPDRELPNGNPPKNPDYRTMVTVMAERTRLANSYNPIFTNNILDHVVRGGPGGGSFSTVLDMLSFLEALKRGDHVSKETVALLTSPKPMSPEYGYGMQLVDGAYGHSGGFLGISTMTLSYPDGYEMIVFSNIDWGSQVAIDKMLELAGYKPPKR